MLVERYTRSDTLLMYFTPETEVFISEYSADKDETLNFAGDLSSGPSASSASGSAGGFHFAPMERSKSKDEASDVGAVPPA